MKKEHNYYVYISTNNPRHTVLYTGITNGLIKRGGQHKERISKKSFSAKYNADKIVYYELYSDVNMATQREKQIKNLVRRKKI
jgi:putative endonuclease